MNSSIWPIDKTLSGATTPGQHGFGKDENEGILCIPKSSRITWASPSNCFVSYLWHSLEKVLLLCRDTVGVFYSPSQLGCIQKDWSQYKITKVLTFSKTNQQNKNVQFNTWKYFLNIIWTKGIKLDNICNKNE